MYVDSTCCAKHCLPVHAFLGVPCIGRLSNITTSANVGPMARLQLVTLPLETLCRSKFGLHGPSNVGWWPAIALIFLGLILLGADCALEPID